MAAKRNRARFPRTRWRRRYMGAFFIHGVHTSWYARFEKSLMSIIHII